MSHMPKLGVVVITIISLVITIISLGTLTCVLSVVYAVHVRRRRGLSVRLFGKTFKVFPLHPSQEEAIQSEIDDADFKKHSIAVFGNGGRHLDAGTVVAVGPLASPLELGIRITLKLAMSFGKVGEKGSEERCVFISELLADVALAAEVPSQRFKVEGLSSGSVLVQLRILPDANGPDPLSVAQCLASQLRDAQSPLKVGTVTRHCTDIGVSPQQLAAQRKLEGLCAMAGLDLSKSAPVVFSWQEAARYGGGGDGSGANQRRLSKMKLSLQAKQRVVHKEVREVLQLQTAHMRQLQTATAIQAPAKVDMKAPALAELSDLPKRAKFQRTHAEREARRRTLGAYVTNSPSTSPTTTSTSVVLLPSLNPLASDISSARLPPPALRSITSPLKLPPLSRESGGGGRRGGRGGGGGGGVGRGEHTGR